jgi:origin recognition complex subunit 3
LGGKEHLLSEDNPLSGEPDQAAKKSGAERNTPSEIVQARFARAISELQFLGFIKHTGRKADHVARLTWGTV